MDSCLKLTLYFLLSIFLFGCVTGHVSESEMQRYKNKNIKEFMNDQFFWNYRKNFIFIKYDNIFFNEVAFYEEQQINAMSENIKNLCKINNGKENITPLDDSHGLFSQIDIYKLSQIPSIKALFNDKAFIKKYKINYSRGVSAQYASKMTEYINKGYFFENFECIIDGSKSWNVSLYPTQVGLDESNIVSMVIFVITN